MHDETFDQVVRARAAGVARRGFLGLVAGLAGVSLARPGAEAGRKKRKKCKPPRIKCGKKCLAAGACCTNAECAAVIGQVCVGNTCECPGGQVVTGNECAKPCNPDCDECQRCDDGECVDLANDTPCTNGGKCKAGACRPDRSFGCTTTQHACFSISGVSCPDSTTAEAKCFVDAAGDSVCGTGLCSTASTDEACESEVGEGAIALPCTPCGFGGSGKTHVCVMPVTQ